MDRNHGVSGDAIEIEYVGIPGYPGSSVPRVLGIARLSMKKPDVSPIRYVHGNALEPRSDGPKIICQMVNDRALRWGGGTARSTAKRFPEAHAEFTRDMKALPAEERLGVVHFSSGQDDIIIASLVAQAGFGKSQFPRIRYGALKHCLVQVTEKSLDLGATIHIPRIGAGSAGGEWHVIEELIEETLVQASLKVTVYDLPPKRKQLGLFD